MKALRFGLSVPRFLVGKAFARFTDSVVFGIFSGLSLTEVPDPPLPGPNWVRLDICMCGVCGSDIGTLTFRSSPTLEPFVSFPAVLGHEVLARVTEVGHQVTRVKVGDRVSVDPSISCLVRGCNANQQCVSCSAGLPATCVQAGEEIGPSPTAPLARGFMVGMNADLPGGYGERMVAHESQLFTVNDSIEDTCAVLTEPLSIGVHAVLRSRPDPATAVFVIGSGPIALGTVWALRSLGHHGQIVSQTKRPNEGMLAREFGASETVTPGAEARRALIGTGARGYKPMVGSEVFAGGGFPVIFDCVGTKGSLDQALRFVAPRGKITVLGCAGEIDSLDLTFLWAREIEIAGFFCYGTETWRDRRLHTFEVTHRLLADTHAPIARLVSHRFPLARYRDAFSAVLHRDASSALKVVLTPN